MRQHGVSQEGKKFCVLHELGNKMQWGEGRGVWVHCESLNGFSGGTGDKTLEKYKIFSLKLV